jgi:hypothetical protein
MNRQLLLTVDEARSALTASARRLLTGADTDDVFHLAAMLWGAGDITDHLNPRDRRLAERHRRTLDRLIAAGYTGEIVDELDGISSAVGLDDGHFVGWPIDHP